MSSSGPEPARFARLARAGRIVLGGLGGMLSATLCLVSAALIEAPDADTAAVPRATPTPGWVEAVRDEIRTSEYAFSRQTDGAWSAPNRVHGVRARIDEAGANVVDRIRGATGFELRLALVGYGRGAALAPIASGEVRSAEDRIEIRREELTEWFVNQPRGLEHGFTLEAPPAGDSAGSDAADAFLSIQLTGSVLVFPEGEDGRSVLFRDAAGNPILRYGELRVVDAREHELPARMVSGSGSLRIEFDDRDAAYPVTVDPLLTTAVWTAEGNQDGASFGVAVAAAGDVNGDGFSDVIVGAEFYDNGEADEGRAFVYAGSATGPSANPIWTAEANQAGASFGRSVATAGDVNNDGFADVLVGAWLYDNGQVDEGRAYLYLGSASGPAAAPAWTVESNQANARYAYAVASAGDVNGDGFSDVIVGAWFYENGQVDEGRAFVYHGSASGLSTTAAWTAESDQVNANFGSAVATAGDVDADGFADVIVSARAYDNGQTDEGRAYLYRGGAGGLQTTPAWTFESNQANALLGVSVAGAGDVNGDGYADVMVGSHFYDNGQTNEGRVFVFYGSALGVSVNPDWTAETNQAVANFGVSVGSAGDVNGDGYADVIVGAWFEDNGQADEGRAYVFQGSATGLSAAPAWTAESDQDGAEFGAAVAGVGDVNGDGFGDVIVGAPLFDNVQVDEGRAYVFLGTAAGLATTPIWRTEPDQATSALGTSVAGAGDVNGDGFSDVIVGAPTFDNGETDEGRAFVYLGAANGLPVTASWTAEANVADARFGAAVSSAGDVNGDGYADVIIGAPRLANGQITEGRAYVFSGSPAGLAATPSWTFESNRPGALFGSAVATAGDVNGDGYADVIVGAPGWANGQATEGSASVFLGSPAGLPAVAGWTVESNQAGARLGAAVASPGDANRDGFSDVAVGAPGYDGPDLDEGRVLVYAGSSSGPAVTATWVLEVNQAGADFGATVATGGDVNSDGYADLLVGAQRYDNGSTDEGAAFLYSGGPSGYAGIVAWTTESNQASANFGYSVASAGDVNADGFGDVIVGAINFDNVHIDEGRALLYLGSASGLAINPAWAVESNQNGAQYGFSVACAGDVNGDGFSDVIVGAPGLDNGSTDEGTAFLYYGNDKGGAARIPRQARANGTGPIAILGSSESPSAFRIRQLGRVPAGRARMRLEMEVKPRGTPLTGTGTVFSTVQSPAGGSGGVVPFDESIGGLAASTGYAWRARMRSTDPLFPRSPWFGVPDNAIRLVDLRTACAAPITYYRDADGDGWGNPAISVGACAPPAGYTTQLADCDDTRATSFPGGTETCNGFDDDCDNQVDESLGTISCGVGACMRTANACSGGGTGQCVPGAPTQELCNNIDDDCNGEVDEVADFGYEACGVGACFTVVQKCIFGDELECVPWQPTPETCNNIDDDCNGFVDDIGQTTCGVGACGRTVQNCDAGVPQTCIPGDPTVETCNNIDDDCDGEADEVADFGYEACGVGACYTVVQRCIAGDTLECVPWQPTPETCNNIDDDCNGVVDDVSQTTCGIGACARTVQDCVDGQPNPNACVPGTPTTETCNNVDDDCNGEVDEVEDFGYEECGVGACYTVVQKCIAGDTLECVPWQPTPETCNDIDDDCNGIKDDMGQTSCGVGACARTVARCVAGVTQTCVAGSPTGETCNTIDDDCDGVVDDLGQTSCGVGRCMNTVDNCTNGVAHACVAFDPLDESCNGLDDDCDGVTDEGMGQTTCGIGPCQRTVDNCSGGAAHACVPAAPTAEACNGIDDDCDGTIDDISVVVSGLRFLANRTSLSWVAEPGAAGFDVVKGDLAALRSSAGNFTGSLLGCLVDAAATPDATDAALPLQGQGFYYLVRSVNCLGATGTYDTTSPAQHAGRDAGIAAAPAACP